MNITPLKIQGSPVFAGLKTTKPKIDSYKINEFQLAKLEKRLSQAEFQQMPTGIIDRKMLSSIFENFDRLNINCAIEISQEEQGVLGLYYEDIPASDKRNKSYLIQLESGYVLAVDSKKEAGIHLTPLRAKESYGKDSAVLGWQYRYQNLDETQKIEQLSSFTRRGRKKIGKEVTDLSQEQLNFTLPKVTDRPLKIMFLSLYPDTSDSIFQSAGPNYIESYLKKKLPDGSVDVLHLETVLEKDEDIKRAIDEYKPDLIGVSTKVNSYKQVKTWMDYLTTERPDTPLVVGGQAVNSSYLEMLEDYPNSLIMFDNGEVPFKMLAQNIQNGADVSELGKIPNLCFLKDGEVTLTQFEDYNYIVNEHSIPSDSNVAKVLAKDGIVSLRLSQGCWGNCTFCTHPGKWHGANMDSVIQVIKEWKDKYGLSGIFFTDDEIVNKSPQEAYQRLNSLADKMVEAELDINWTTSLRADCIEWLDDKLIEKLKKAGCTSAFLGIESGSETQLKRYGKYVKGVDVSVETNKKAIKLFADNNMKVGIGWIPFDPLMPTLRELKENIAFIEDNNLLEQNIRLDSSMRAQRGANYTHTLGSYKMGLLGALQPNMFHYDTTYIDPRVGAIRDHIRKWTDDMRAFDEKSNGIKFAMTTDPSKAQKYKPFLDVAKEIQILTIDYMKAMISLFDETSDDRLLDGVISEDETTRKLAQQKMHDKEFMKNRREDLLIEVSQKRADMLKITQEFSKKRDELLASVEYIK